MASSLLATSCLSSDSTTGIRCANEFAPRFLPHSSSGRNYVRLTARAQAEPDSSSQVSETLPPRKKKEKIPTKKQQVMLKFVWMEKNIGIGLDHVIPGHGTVPLSPYYFWPRKDAWEEIKTKLESKKWISRKQTILLLNQATDIINLWQQNATS